MEACGDKGSSLVEMLKNAAKLQGMLTARSIAEATLSELESEILDIQDELAVLDLKLKRKKESRARANVKLNSIINNIDRNGCNVENS